MSWRHCGVTPHPTEGRTASTKHVPASARPAEVIALPVTAGDE
jgi:hypothetical protein